MCDKCQKTSGYLLSGLEALGKNWQQRKGKKYIQEAREILTEKFTSVNNYGPQQVVEFHNSQNKDERESQARRAFELVKRFLEYSTP